MPGSRHTPVVSVVLPVYNGARTIGAAVASILEQSLVEIELIVVDDASTDHTAEVLRSIDDERVRIVINAERLGLVASLNAAVEMASCALIARMDADDVASRDRLALGRDLLRASPQVGLVATAYTAVDDDGRELGYVGVPSDHASVVFGLLFGNCIAHSTVMFRRDVFRRVGGYRAHEFPAEDYGLWLRMVDVTQVATMASAQVVQRRSATGLSATLRDQQIARTCALSAAAIERTIGERPPERIVAGLAGLGAPLGCTDFDEALGYALAAYKKVRRASRGRKAPYRDLPVQLPRIVLQCGLRDPSGALCRDRLPRLVVRHPVVSARLARRHLRLGQ